MQLRGRAEPVHVYLQEPMRSFGDTAATAYGDVEPAQAEPECIRLIWLDIDRVYAGTSLPVILGRSLQATYRSTTTGSRVRMRASTGTAARSSSPT